MLLTSTLIAVLLLGLLAFVLGVAIGCTLAWTQGRLPWAGSDLPADLLDDPSFDYAALGWWTETPVWFPSDLEGQTAFVLPADAVLIELEEVVRPYLTIWHVIEGAQR